MVEAIVFPRVQPSKLCNILSSVNIVSSGYLVGLISDSSVIRTLKACWICGNLKLDSSVEV